MKKSEHTLSLFIFTTIRRNDRVHYENGGYFVIMLEHDNQMLRSLIINAAT